MNWEGQTMQIDVKLINPFIQASMSVIQMITGKGLTVGKPEKNGTQLKSSDVLIQVGIVGELNGQVILEISTDNAKKIASTMMCGMPVETLDDMACSAISELGNMIMGNAATVFSVADILIDITPPILVNGGNVSVHSTATSIRIPLLMDGEEYIKLNILVNAGRKK